ncbi:hypothetical protein LOK49_LG15G00652 [Camellia lanceoleosa]|uniref:Uncharacterized protein n=1 Tax=Camellia lanceoleosa TaxID=1840588 RepID=A0ACC0F1A5_9ERIC|nr:hypothetical protein LOK49_LG15G00652 [Camellia lanceoleosa]
MHIRIGDSDTTLPEILNRPHLFRTHVVNRYIYTHKRSRLPSSSLRPVKRGHLKKCKTSIEVSSSISKPMSPAIHCVTQNFSGYGTTDGRCVPFSGVSGRAFSLSPSSSRGDYKTLSQIKIILPRFTSRGMYPLCKAGSSGYRRNPDFSRQNRHGFSRNRNRQNEERDGSETLEESELFPSKNGPLLSVSGGPKFQATATPGPREKEIVELFRKVQAQLRERAAVKEEKKTELSQRQGKESKTVDSLLKLLRKHTTQQGKQISSDGSSREFVLDQHDQNGAFEEEKSTISLDLNNTVKDEPRDRESPPLSRPVSNFQRRSPVPQVKFQQNHSESVADTLLDGKRHGTHLEPEIHELQLEIEPEPIFSNGDVFDGLSEDEPSDIDENYSEDDAEKQKPIVDKDLNSMKLPELRALAKSRGVKGFSKLKKRQLLELLIGGST